VEGLGGGAGTPPTNWNIANAGGYTQDWSVGVIDGVRHAVLRLHGSPGGTNTYAIRFDGIGFITAAVGQTWTFSTGFILLAGTIPVTPTMVLRERGGASTPTTNLNLDGNFSTHRRFIVTRTLTVAGTNNITGEMVFSSLPGTVDFTVAFPLPDIKQRAWASSPIYTVDNTTAAVTRVAENISVPRSAWYNPAGMTIYADWNGRATVDRSIPVALHRDGTLRHYFYVNSNGDVVLFSFDGDNIFNQVTAFNIGTSTSRRLKSCVYWSNGVVKWVVARETGQLFENYAITPARSLQLTDAALNLKFGENTIRQAQDYVRDVRAFPRELTNAQMRDLCRF
jgi:hypothetical protein